MGRNPLRKEPKPAFSRLGFVHLYETASPVFLIFTAANFHWLQLRAPKEMLGRVMSMMMFSSTGLAPVSQAISGAVSKWDLDLLLILSGVLMILVTLWMAFQPGLKAFCESLVGQPSGNVGPALESAPGD